MISYQPYGHPVFEGFEFSVQYLLKYDRSFVLPNIEKYARGALSPEEREKNRYLNPDYMTAFAKEIVV